MPAFMLPALCSTLGNILGAIIILFIFFKKRVFPYKTLFFSIHHGCPSVKKKKKFIMRVRTEHTSPLTDFVEPEVNRVSN